MILSKTNVNVTFFWNGELYRANSKSIKVKYQDKSKKMYFYFDFPSYKSNLNINQDAEDILNYLNTFDTLEFDDHNSIKNLNNIFNQNKIDEVEKELILNLPKVQIQTYKDVQIELDGSRMTFKIKTN
ncbi:MAG: hypothetical protein IPN86_03675 [Saprospiraceae bacterium]|jgi:hypothetical protein|nr:hypothetical protein [Saprospiraceae bacterium]